MSDQDIALMAHLLRRAGFGATRDELEAYQVKGYEATVEDLLNPGLVIGKLVKLAPPFAKSPFLIVRSTDQFELEHPVLLLDKRQHSAIIADVEGGTN